jgi:hypothetical protein
LKTTPAIVIEAICAAIVEDPKKADDAAKAILRARAEMETTTEGAAVDPSPTLISNALKDLDLSPQEQKEIAAMLTVKPMLYECVAETFDRNNELAARSGGFYLLSDGRTMDAFKQRGAFLSWEQKTLE